MKQSHTDKFDDETLINEFNKHNHLGKTSVALGVPQVTVWRRLKRLGIEVKGNHSNSRIPLSEILEGKHPHYQTFKLNTRLLKEGIKENKCEVCGITTWNGKEIRFQLDHINGNSADHRLENLRLICPNCHSQTETYCGKNKK